uniref:RHS repeat domain-containing protein n=1 Tax=uncultured Dysgonomonas sp. TaxID=206096 RepID=UPI0026039035
ARFYDPGYSRFTTPDPLSEKFYNWSPYVYCYNNPMKFVDKDGKQGVLPVPGGAIPIPMAPVAVPTNQSTTNQLAEQGRTIKNTVSEAANLIQGATIIAGTKFLMDIGVLEASSNPGYTNQRKNDRVAKEGLDAAQAAVAKGIQDNMPSPSFDNGGGSDPKRSPQGTLAKIVLRVAAGAGVVQQLTNPNPSNDAHDAHLETASKKVNQQPQDPPREQSRLEKFIDWLKK